jgi:hypothetical protein
MTHPRRNLRVVTRIEGGTFMATEANVPTTIPPQYTPPNVPLTPPTRDPAAVITELMRRCMLHPRSRDENAFIDLHKGLHD